MKLSVAFPTSAYLLLLLWPGVSFPQSLKEEIDAVKKEMESLRMGQKAMQTELEKIKSLLRGRQTAAPQAPKEIKEILVSVEDDPFKGERTAKLAIVEFSDYQCPFCARHFRETLPQIETDYIKTGKVKYVFRNFPIESIHPLAFKAAEAAHCAGEQEKYWEMHDRLFSNQKALGLKDLSLHAQALRLNLANFQQCLDSGKQAAKIRKDKGDGQTAGVRATPTFFFGLTESEGSKVRALLIIGGAQPYSTFKQALERLPQLKNNKVGNAE